MPAIGGVALVGVRDRNTLVKDEYVGEVAVSFDEVYAAFCRGERPRLAWHHLYDMGDAARAVGASTMEGISSSAAPARTSSSEDARKATRDLGGA